MDDLKQNSKKAYNGNGTIEHINAGSLQRIADATEKMATNYVQLQNNADMYKRWYDEKCTQNHLLNKRISALKGVITKLKKKR